MKVEVTALSVPWRAPLVASHAEVGAEAERPLLLLALTGHDGVTGYGEAAPIEGYDGVSMDAVREALARSEGVLRRSDGDDLEALVAACAQAAPLPEALAAIDMALWDLAGRRAGEPVWKLLGGAGGGDADAGAIAVNATIGAVAPARAADQAAGAVAAGFRCVKVKVGVGEDEQRLAAVRAAVGPEVAIRVDANGAWTVPQAVESLASLGASGVELCEEPVHGLDGIAAVSTAARDSAVNGVHVAIAVDESARDPAWRAARVCDAVCLKVARCGGVSGVVADAAAARRARYGVYLASTLDGPLGIAAALHAAAVVSPDRHCGLATLGRFERPDPVGVRAGSMSPPDGAGLGDGLLGWYRDVVRVDD